MEHFDLSNIDNINVGDSFIFNDKKLELLSIDGYFTLLDCNRNIFLNYQIINSDKLIKSNNLEYIKIAIKQIYEFVQEKIFMIYDGHKYYKNDYIYWFSKTTCNKRSLCIAELQIVCCGESENSSKIYPTAELRDNDYNKYFTK